jgi:ribose transport system ATP-binding protein
VRLAASRHLVVAKADLRVDAERREDLLGFSGKGSGHSRGFLRSASGDIASESGEAYQRGQGRLKCRTVRCHEKTPVKARQAPPVLAFAAVRKVFGGTVAVDDVTLDLARGEILALLGENGAGKSTMIKMLAGIHSPDGGAILFKGEPYAHRPPVAGEPQRVAFIHQDLGLIEWMTVAENMALGQGYERRFGLIDWRAAERRAAAALARVGLAGLEPSQRVQSLSRTEKSLLAIGRALAVEAEVLVLDEPTASLPADEVERLFDVLRDLRARGVAMIYVSHRLDEVFAIADRVAVLRDGRLVGTRPVAETSADELIELIIGRRTAARHWRGVVAAGTTRLVVESLATEEAGPVDFTVAAGECVALVGLRGAGQVAIGRVLFGAAPRLAGRVRLDGREPDLETPRAAMASGVSFVSGERVDESLLARLSMRENLFANPGARGRGLLELRRRRGEEAEAATLGERFDVRPNEPERPIETFSGGNQQKIVMARWLAIAAPVLILEEPTAGVDVGAKIEIYELLAAARRAGTAVIVVSTDFEEVERIADRALVFGRGRITAELSGDDLTQESVLHAASAVAGAWNEAATRGLD